MRQFIVIGLGRFGRSTAKELYDMGYQVMAIDVDEEKVRYATQYCTNVMECDATDENALRSIGITNFDVAIVAIGDIKPSILVSAILIETGIQLVVAKAQDRLHGKVLEKIGVNRIVYPERDMGSRLAHNLIASNIIDYIEISPDHSILEISPTKEMLNKSLMELDFRNQFGVNIMAIKHDGNVNITPGGQDVIKEGHILIVLGHNDSLKRIQVD